MNVRLNVHIQPAEHLDVKLWLRLLACTTQIEQAIRQRLRLRFNTTLPRFDYLAQLERHADGLRMSELSRSLMVTGGNVTGLTDALVVEGWVERQADPLDGRSWRVSLTPRGRREFKAMAVEHEGWLAELLAGLDPAHKQRLYEQLGSLRRQLAPAPAETGPATIATTPDAQPTVRKTRSRK
jgi:DNA-binding MarR family transcriptional regulator